MPSRDEDAFRWEGDDDRPPRPGADVPGPAEGGPDPATSAGVPSEEASAGPPADEPGTKEPLAEEPSGDEPVAGEPATDAPDDEGPAPLGSVALVSLGLLGGVYALWTIGWAIGALRLRDRIEGVTSAVADLMFQGSMVLAIASPAVWFAASWLGTRGGRPWQRFAWLAAGAVLLVPWPFVMVGVLG